MTLPVLNPGVQLDVISETTTGSGTTRRDLVIQSDAVLATLSVTAITGTLDVTVYSLVGDAESALLTFPTVSAPTTLEIRQSSTTTSNLRVRAQYSGVCTYRVQCRAVGGGVQDAATAANQLAEIALLTSIDSDTSAIAASVAAIDIDTSAIAASVAAIDIDTSAIATSTAGIDSSANAIEASTASIDGKLNSLGQKTMAGSVPVVLASNQTDLPIGQITGPVALPTGAATAANQTSEIALLTTINSTLSAIDTSANAIEASVASIDTKVSTAAKQDIGNASLAAIDADTTAIANSVAAIDIDTTNIANSVSSIDTKTPALVSGRVPVDGSGVTQPISAVSLPLPTGAATAAHQVTANSSLSAIAASTASIDTDIDVALSTRASESTLSTLNSKLNTLGQKTSAASAPVVIASDQSAIPASQSGTWNINNITGTVSLPTGAATAAGQTTGNASLASIDAGIPAALGQTTAANSMPVVIASDQSAVPASQSGTWNINNVTGTISLPTGAATAANQTTGNASLSSIDGKLAASTTTPSLTSNATIVRPIPYEPETYSAAIVGLVLAASPTDVFTIIGSATKTVRVHGIRISGTTTSGSPIKVSISLVRRSTANTGGTSTTPTAVSHDTNNAAATAVVRAYTANPTLGTLVGVMRSQSTSVQSAGITEAIEWDFEHFGQLLVLRGVAQQLSVNFNATSITGSVISIYVEWSEV